MSAQNDWDSVLDRYESITARCKELRYKDAARVPVLAVRLFVGMIFMEPGRRSRIIPAPGFCWMAALSSMSEG